MTVRKIAGLVLCGVLVGGGSARASESVSVSSFQNGAGENLAQVIARGEYVARMADCAACHVGADGSPYAGGYEIASPLGTIVATNISPSREFGIGGWSEEVFARAIRKGVTPHGYLYPAMPYPSYAGMSDEDVHALYMYLTHAVKPVERGPTVSTNLPFPFNLRWLMTGWNAVFSRQRPMDHAMTAPGGAERGRYLVEVVGHCSNCHTPRNLAMAEDHSKFLAGAAVGGWFAPNITSDPVSGIGGWSEDELVTYLRTGAVVGKSQAAGGMAEAIEHGLRHLADDDLRAIAQYLKSVPPIREVGQTEPAYGVAFAQPSNFEALNLGHDRSPAAMTDGASTQGEQIYVAACAACHQLHGEGTLDQFYPSLYANTATGGTSPRNLVMAIVKGVHRETNDGAVVMPAFGAELNDAQIAAVSNYVLSRFGNPDLSVSAAEVGAYRVGLEEPLLVKLFGPVGAMAALGGTAAGLAGMYLTRRKRREISDRAAAKMTIED